MELARVRTMLSYDRTLLAWIRTSLSLIAFGFTLARFVHDMMVSGTLRFLEPHYPREVGLTLMMLGIGGLIAGVVNHYHSVRVLRSVVPVSPWSASMVVALVLAMVGVLMIINLCSSFRP